MITISCYRPSSIYSDPSSELLPELLLSELVVPSSSSSSTAMFTSPSGAPITSTVPAMQLAGFRMSRPFNVSFFQAARRFSRLARSLSASHAATSFFHSAQISLFCATCSASATFCPSAVTAFAACCSLRDLASASFRIVSSVCALTSCVNCFTV